MKKKKAKRLCVLLSVMMALALAPVCSFGAEFEATVTPTAHDVTEGSIHHDSVAYFTADRANVSAGTIITSHTYQWYSCKADGSEKVVIPGADEYKFQVPEELTDGQYHFVCSITGHDYNGTAVETVDTAVVTVYVADGTPVVIFDANGGNFAETGETVKETKITDGKVSDPGIPGKEGFAFTGWWTTPDAGGEQISDVGAYEFTHTTRLYARYNIEKTAIFDANGGSFEEGVTEYYISFFGDFVSKDELPPDPTRDGYVFAGWYLKGGDGEEYALTPIPGEDGYEFPSDGMVIYAKWSKLDESPAAGDKNNMLPWMLAAGMAALAGSAVRFRKKSI